MVAPGRWKQEDRKIWSISVYTENVRSTGDSVSKTKIKSIHTSNGQCYCCFPEPEGKTLLPKTPHALGRSHREIELEDPISYQVLWVQDAASAGALESWSTVILSTGLRELYCHQTSKMCPLVQQWQVCFENKEPFLVGVELRLLYRSKFTCSIVKAMLEWSSALVRNLLSGQDVLIKLSQ